LLTNWFFMFNNLELEQITAGTFVLDFVESRLTQQRDEEPDVYLGSATIIQDENKALKLKLLGKLQSKKSMVEQFMNTFNGELTSGKLIGRENYYSFFGVDMSGREWTAEDVYIEIKANMNNGNYGVHSRRLRELRHVREPIKLNSAKHCMLIPGKFDIPFNLVQDDQNERGLSKCLISIEEQRDIVVETKGENLLVTITTPDAADDKYKDRVLEALGIAMGAHLYPQIEMIRAPDRYELVLRSVKSRHTSAARLVSPVVNLGHSNFPDFAKFVLCYLQTYSEPFQQVAGLWFRILTAYDSSLENQGLIIAMACEGVIRAEFEDECKPEQIFLEQLSEARPLVKKLNVQPRAKARLIASIDMAKNSTVSNALRSLTDSQKIPKNLRMTWQSLRNKLAHASELDWEDDKMQEFIDSLYACLELFYRLIMIRIKYDGRLRALSKSGWPTELYYQFKT
jgi:hypothetical protein